MRSSISEFSYGYALTEKLVRLTSPLVNVAPRFPSLREEGMSGHGYDLKIDFGIPVFIQFKLSDFLKNKSAKEISKHKLDPPLTLPIYRMHLRSRKYSNQHESLLFLEEQGHAVYYAAPIFASWEELDQHYSNNTVIENSIFINPSEIGRIDDDDDHFVSFSPSLLYAYRFSQPLFIKSRLDHHSFVHQIERRIETSDMRFSTDNLTDNYFTRLTNQILETVSTSSSSSLFTLNRAAFIADMPPLERLSYVTQALLGSQLFFMGYRGR